METVKIIYKPHYVVEVTLDTHKPMLHYQGKLPSFSFSRANIDVIRYKYQLVYNINT